MSSATPRSGRSKKKSALSRFALKSGINPQGSDESEREHGENTPQESSQEDLRSTATRPRINTDGYHRYPVAAADARRATRDTDSDEGIEMGSRYKASGPERSNQRQLHDSEESEATEDSDESPQNKWSNQKHQNHDSDEEITHNTSRSQNRSLFRAGSAEDLERPHSRLGMSPQRGLNNHSNRNKFNTHGYPHSDSDDEEVDFAPKSKHSPSLNATLTMKQSREEMTHLYQDALNRAEREIELEAELGDDLADLRRFSHSPPRPSARSPVPHEFHRQVTNNSIASSITSRAFKQGVQPDPFGCGSQGSMQSSSVLPMISTKQAKNRSFLVGSVAGNGALLGAEELERYFPDRKMRIFVGTWNMCELNMVPECLDDFILPDTSDYVHDMYVIGTQESTPNRREWELSLQETLGPQHVLLHSASHGVLYLAVFIRRDLIWYTSTCEEASITTRPGPKGVKTKGAVASAFSVFGTSFLFLCTHLSPHDGRIKDRIADYNKINSGLQLPKNYNSDPKKNADVTSRYDCVFWLGDMNFRIEKERDRVVNKVQGIEAQDLPNFEELVVHDELSRARNEGLAFQEFQEGRIKFKPTYKYDKGTDTFCTSKKMRIPSYTDRVLFRCKVKHSVTCLHYDSASEVRSSDHKPVYGMYEVNLRPGRDNIPLSAGHFNKEIWSEAMRRRGARLDLNNGKSQKSSSICSIQ